MKPIALEDVIPLGDYERQREAFRSRIIALKQRRRISIGPLVTLIFENRETLQFQTQEMIRVEHIRDPHKVQEELDVYNALMPESGELDSAGDSVTRRRLIAYCVYVYRTSNDTPRAMRRTRIRGDRFGRRLEKSHGLCPDWR